MLSAVHWRFESTVEGLYKPTHKHHPCTLWAGESAQNYLWGHALLVALCNEYTFRYNKVHKTSRLIGPLAGPPAGIASKGLTEFPQAMPEEYKSDDVVEAYRSYYCGAKSGFAKWSVRDTPAWFERMLV